LQYHTPPHGSTLFAAVKTPEAGRGAFAFGFWLLPFRALLWAFWCGKLLKGKRVIEGKRGKMLKRG
jgi:hypothetical protein